MTVRTFSGEHAVRIHAYGDTTQMVYESIEVAPPAAGEVQIRQRAIGINYLDTYHRRGVFPLPDLPAALGVEASGKIVAVGSGVTGFALGDRVAYASRAVGSYATLRNLSTRHLLHLPDAVSYEQAAAATLQGLTVHMLTEKVTRLDAEHIVLVHAAAGGLGLLLVQELRRRGCRVIGTAGSPEKAQLARDHGCDHVILYRQQSFGDAVRRITDGMGVDCVFEGLGGRVFHESLNVLRPFGQIVNLGQVAEGLPTVSLAELGPVRSLTVSVPGVFAYVGAHRRLQDAADVVYDHIAALRWRVHIGGRFPLRDAASAHDELQRRSTTGSLILLPE